VPQSRWPLVANLTLPSLVKALSALACNVTMYAAPCLSAGSVVAVFHRRLELDLLTAFTLGFFSFVGPVYLTYASGWGMRRTLVQLQSWRAAGLIQAREYDDLRREALAWFRARRFGP
jgi:hypothetical protein